jgi:hypothetical protein
MSSKNPTNPLHRRVLGGINHHISREPGFRPEDLMAQESKATRKSNKLASKALKARTKAIKKLGA